MTRSSPKGMHAAERPWSVPFDAEAKPDALTVFTICFTDGNISTHRQSKSDTSTCLACMPGIR